MLTTKSTLSLGLLVFIPLFGMQTDDVLRRARGNSRTVKVALEKLCDSPAESQPRTPELLTPTAIGLFDFEKPIEELSDNEDEQYITFINSQKADNSLSSHEQEKKSLSRPKKLYLSEADLCKNWREAKEPKKPFPLREDKNKKSRQRPFLITIQKNSGDQNNNPRSKKNVNPQQTSSPTSPQSFTVYTPTASLMVVSTAATLHKKKLSSNNPFAFLPEQNS
jgi:hypothetical protein